MNKMITIVSGLPRSGTSMMMRIIPMVASRHCEERSDVAILWLINVL